MATSPRSLRRNCALALKGRTALKLIDPGQRIRATVIGASQFTVQVSGKTIYLPRPGLLPVHNVPVVHVGRGLDAERLDRYRRRRGGDQGCRWRGSMAGPRCRSRSRSPGPAIPITRASPLPVAPSRWRSLLWDRASAPLFLVIDGDIGKTFGRILAEEIGLACDLVSIDGVALQELDFVDIGELTSPPGVVPVVIKSLLFS